MIKIQMTSPDLDRWMELLKLYPEFFAKHFKPMLWRNVQKGKVATAAGVPRRTGKAAAAIRARVSGSGTRMEGVWGWYGKSQPWYINIVEHGAKAHKIVPRNADGWLRLQGGRYVKEVDHPGFAERRFMMAAYKALKPQLDADIQRANEAVLNELVV